MTVIKFLITVGIPGDRFLVRRIEKKPAPKKSDVTLVNRVPEFTCATTVVTLYPLDLMTKYMYKLERFQYFLATSNLAKKRDFYIMYSYKYMTVQCLIIIIHILEVFNMWQLIYKDTIPCTAFCNCNVTAT